MSKKLKQELSDEEKAFQEFWNKTKAINKKVFRKLRVLDTVTIKWLDAPPVNAMVIEKPRHRDEYSGCKVINEDGAEFRVEFDQVIAIVGKVTIEPCTIQI